MTDDYRKKWLLIVQLRSSGYTLAKCGQAAGVTRQRAHAIIKQARHYVLTAPDGDQLAAKLRQSLEVIDD